MVEIKGKGAVSTIGLYRVIPGQNQDLTLMYRGEPSVTLQFGSSSAKSRAYIKICRAIEEREAVL